MPREIYYFVSLVISLTFLWWLLKNVTLTHACPKCGSNDYVKRVNRGIISKYFLFFMFAKKFRCSKCWKEYFQLFGAYKPDPNSHPLKKEMESPQILAENNKS